MIERSVAWVFVMVERTRVDGESQHDEIIDGDEDAELGSTRFSPENLLGIWRDGVQSCQPRNEEAEKREKQGHLLQKCPRGRSWLRYDMQSQNARSYVLPEVVYKLIFLRECVI